jgi:chitin-binding protein
MTARRKATRIVVLGFVPLALAGLAAGAAAAHGSMTDPVSRVAACYAEGPEHPKSAACKAAVAAGGTQALYDWNAVRLADAGGKSRALIPDGKLCSAGNPEFKGLDLARADWPSSKMTAGNRTFRYKGTAPHRGSFELYITKDGYDPGEPLAWSDLEPKPFLKVTDPKMEKGDYVFNGIVPNRSGRHLIYSVWQRSDSPEAFYTCSDVVFGADKGSSSAAAPAAPAAPAASAPSEQEIAHGADKSSAGHSGHAAPSARASVTSEASPVRQPDADVPVAQAAGAPAQRPAGGADNLAATGSGRTTPYVAMGGATILAVGAAVMFGAVRRKAVPAGRHSR